MSRRARRNVTAACGDISCQARSQFVILASPLSAAPALFRGSGRLCVAREEERRVTEPPGTPPAAPRPRPGGRVAGQSYAPLAPAVAGGGSRFPLRDYSGVDDPALRATYVWW